MSLSLRIVLRTFRCVAFVACVAFYGNQALLITYGTCMPAGPPATVTHCLVEGWRVKAKLGVVNEPPGLHLKVILFCCHRNRATFCMTDASVINLGH